MTHYIVSAFDAEDLGGMPVAEVEIDADNEDDAIDKAKASLRQKLTTLDGLIFTAQASTS